MNAIINTIDLAALDNELDHLTDTLDLDELIVLPQEQAEAVVDLDVRVQEALTTYVTHLDSADAAELRRQFSENFTQAEYDFADENPWVPEEYWPELGQFIVIIVWEIAATRLHSNDMEKAVQIEYDVADLSNFEAYDILTTWSRILGTIQSIAE